MPTGIDTESFKKCDSDIRERYSVGKAPLLLGVANPWRERKGFEDFLKLSEKMGERVRIAMIGLSRKQADRVSKYSNIIPVMKTDSLKEMAEWYSTSDIYVNLTYEDTFPTTNLEAMACGTPVITYRAGGSPESVIEETGRIREIGDIAGVIESVDELLAGDRDRQEKACTERARLYRSEERFRQYIEEVYGL